MSTTRTMLYGNVTASIKTVGLVGIVTAFITMVRIRFLLKPVVTGC